MFQNGLKGQALTPLFFAFCFGMVLSTMLNQRSLEKEAPAEPLMTYRGLDKFVEDLPEDIALELERRYREFEVARVGYLEEAALRFKVLDHAQKAEVSVDVAAEQLYDFEQPNDSEISGYYALHRDELGKPFYEVKESIRKRLVYQKAREKRTQVLDELKTKGDLIIHHKGL